MKKSILISFISAFYLSMAAADLPRKICINVKDKCFNMILVEGGSFMMGYDHGQRAEKPVHKVTLNSFYMAETETTQEIWNELMDQNNSFSNGDRLPVERHYYNDILEFIKKLSQLTGQPFRLPTEAEWEYAARGGRYSKGYTYSGSNNANEVAWNFNNSDGTTHEVGMLKPNELGLYDMSGNVWEWCEDYYHRYSADEQENPHNDEKGSYRVVRGGSWCGSDTVIRTTYRSYDGPASAVMINGFRLVMDIQNKAK